MTLPRVKSVAAALLALAAGTGTAAAHPHVFAEARLELAVSPDGTVEALRHVWRFDELFSSTILLDFDKNADNLLNEEEAAEVARIVKESIAEFNYFNTVSDNGKDVDMTIPGDILVDYADGQVTMLLESTPRQAMKVAGKVTFGVYDPTFYTAIDFMEDTDLVVENMPAGCTSAVVRPDPDEAIAANTKTLTEAFWETTTESDMGKLFATRLEITCG